MKKRQVFYHVARILTPAEFKFCRARLSAGVKKSASNTINLRMLVAIRKHKITDDTALLAKVKVPKAARELNKRKAELMKLFTEARTEYTLIPGISVHTAMREALMVYEKGPPAIQPGIFAHALQLTRDYEFLESEMAILKMIQVIKESKDKHFSDFLFDREDIVAVSKKLFQIAALEECYQAARVMYALGTTAAAQAYYQDAKQKGTFRALEVAPENCLSVLATINSLRAHILIQRALGHKEEAAQYALRLQEVYEVHQTIISAHPILRDIQPAIVVHAATLCLTHGETPAFMDPGNPLFQKQPPACRLRLRLLAALFHADAVAGINITKDIASAIKADSLTYTDKVWLLSVLSIYYLIVQNQPSRCVYFASQAINEANAAGHPDDSAYPWIAYLMAHTTIGNIAEVQKGIRALGKLQLVPFCNGAELLLKFITSWCIASLNDQVILISKLEQDIKELPPGLDTDTFHSMYSPFIWLSGLTRVK